MFISLPSFGFEGNDKSNKKEKPLVVFVTGDHEYSGENTLPIVAQELEKAYNIRAVVLKSSPNQNSEKNIPGLEILKEADLAVFYLRWRQLPADQLAMIEDYLKTGKPVMGFRTSTHAFNFPKGHTDERWNAFGEFALNAPPGWGGAHKHTHYGHESSTDVYLAPGQAKHPVLTGVNPSFHVRSWLYHVLPNYPKESSQVLLMGKAVDPNRAAVDNPIAWTGTNGYGARIFMTTMGHPEDFRVESFQRLVINAIHWELGLKVPKKWKGVMDIQVPYRGMVK
ncbi:ThuA domain-containing protein [Dyadobacter jejuensis]|uniref:ThuA domain-containing protein n=1 Tax=Dyadobacter jejuensis TaxID=1082580 RepID=UPI001E64A4A6|nr:ThuA domain-containing protein [Dyadobacter jejuensis]